MSTLLEIKDFVQQFAEAMSAALRLDVEIIDEQLQRIAGTGEAKKLIGRKMTEKGIVNKLMKSKMRRVILDNPGSDEICLSCPNYGKCFYKKAVYALILHEDESIGVIGITATNDEQAVRMQSNKNELLEFVDKTAMLFSSKIKENQMMRQSKTYATLMNQVIENVDNGIVILNKENRIMDVNEFLVTKLKLPKEDLLSLEIHELFPDIELKEDQSHRGNVEYQEITYKSNGRIMYFLCKVKPIVINDVESQDQEIEASICLIEDYMNTKATVYRLTESTNQISLADIIGENPEFVAFKSKVKNVAANDSTVLLVGETGTGKELFARAIHYESSRRKRPFITLNCGAIPESLIESELFGYEKGAFTGASTTGKHGKFYLADKGTIFLDEVETTPLYLQQKLLRVIENKQIEKVGAGQTIPVDVRIVAATNVRLDEMVRKGEFREDLFHRMNVVSLFVPPLRDRGNDVLVLADYFIGNFAGRFNKRIDGLSEEVKMIFLNYSWPGNARELQNTIEYAINMETAHLVTKENLPFQFKDYQPETELSKLEEVERHHITKALDRYGWSEEGRLKAAAYLGISRATIYRKIKKYRM